MQHLTQNETIGIPVLKSWRPWLFRVKCCCVQKDNKMVRQRRSKLLTKKRNIVTSPIIATWEWKTQSTNWPNIYRLFRLCHLYDVCKEKQLNKHLIFNWLYFFWWFRKLRRVLILIQPWRPWLFHVKCCRVQKDNKLIRQRKEKLLTKKRNIVTSPIIATWEWKTQSTNWPNIYRLFRLCHLYDVCKEKQLNKHLIFNWLYFSDDFANSDAFWV